MKLKSVPYLFTFILCGVLFYFVKEDASTKNNNHDFAPKGMIAYAASYSSDPTNEPQYSTQNTKTFQYLNLGNTLDSYRGDSVKVGIIDSGINYDHEDFMVSGSTKVKGDSKYYEYQTSSWVYYKASQHGYSYIDDTLGHGTNVAATVAAAINSVGGLGLAPNVELYVYKVTNSSNGYEFGAIQNALMDAKTLGLDVINMSFQSYEHEVSYGGSTMPASAGCSTILAYYLNQAHNAGITLVGAAGNYNTNEPSYPGSNDHVINVGSLNQTATDKAGFSNYGSTIDLVAPGYVHVADKGTNSSYKDTSGTSFSAPLVTAAIALYKQKYPSATPNQIETALYASCDPIDDSGSAYTNWAGNGALNVAKFLGVEEDSPTDIVINNPEVVNEELELEVGDTFDLDWTVNGVGTFDHSVTIYPFDDNGTLSVDNSGHITALKEGSDYVVIESNVDSSVYTQVYVTVTSSGGGSTVSSVTVSPSSLSLDLNGTKTGTLTATVNGDNNPSQDVTWTSSNTSVATVSNGVVTAKANGSATITATSQQDPTKSGTCSVTVSTTEAQTLTITRSSFASDGGYAWYDWTQKATDNTSISGKGELYTTTTTSMQFNKSKGDKVAAIFNTTAIPGSITKIEATSQQTTIRSWTAYVTSTACSASGSTLTFGSNKTTVGTVSPAVGTSTSFGTSTAGYSYFCIQENDSSASYISEFKITYTPKLLSSISVKTAPNKVNYEVGDYFDPTGLVITKTFSDNTTADVSYALDSAHFSFNPTTSTALTTSHTSVTITYGGKTCNQPITVSAAKTLSSISISGYTTSFVEGDTFAFGGTVTAHFSDSSTADVTSSSIFTGYNMTTLGNQTVTVSYTYKGVTKTASYSLTINQGTLSSISVTGMTIEYIKNQGFSFDGTCTATFANGYQKVVTPTSVSSPDMSTAGEKTITVTFTYYGQTRTTTYQITVNSNRVVYEEQEIESLLGTVTYPNNTQTISVNTLSVGTSGYTTIENNSIRLGSGSNTGTVTVTSTTSNIYKIVVSAKTYGSDTGVTLTIGGTSNTITSSYANYNKEYATPTNSVAIATTTSKKRANIQTITIYTMTKQNVNISDTADCQGLEEFIDTYMHMDYVDNLGYCKDNEHHYYSTAKAAFNQLNDHQRKLFTGNVAYSNEWARLQAWAIANGETLNSNNQLVKNNTISLLTNIDEVFSGGGLIVVACVVSLSSVLILYLSKKRKKD